MVLLRNAILSAGIALMVSVPSFAQKSTSDLFKHPSQESKHDASQTINIPLLKQSRITTYCVQSKSHNKKVSSFNQLLDLIISYQEKNTNITYDSQRPHLKFKKFNSNYAFAKYDSRTKTIWMHELYLDLNIDDLINNIGSRKLSPDEYIVRNGLAHELGHFLTDTYVEKYAPDSWIDFSFKKHKSFSLEQLDNFIVIEGIAEYFANLFVTDAPLFKKSVFELNGWDKKYSLDSLKTKKLKNKLVYLGGTDLVEPILENDVHKGLIYLLKTELIIDVPDLSPVIDYKKDAKHYFTNNSE